MRDCAKASPAFQQLLDAYTQREKASHAARAAGKKVVVEMGCDVPDELILAAGMMPIRIYADEARPLTEADKYLEFSFDPVVRAWFEKLIDGAYANECDYLAISNSTDVIIRAWLYLREMRRSLPELPIPPLTFIDWLFTRKMIHQVRNEDIIRLFIKDLEDWSGTTLTDEAIAAAAVVCNENRAALRRMQELRRCDQPRISGSEALVIIGAGFFLPKEEHTALVLELVEEAQNWPVLDGPRVFFTGSAQESTAIYELLEDAGAVVVGEDHDWGDRSYERDYDLSMPPVRAIVDRYMLRSFSSKKAFVSQRVKALDEHADACRADGVFFCFNEYDEAGSWDYPSQKKSLEGRGIATAARVKLRFPLETNEGLAEELAAFVGNL